MTVLAAAVVRWSAGLIASTGDPLGPITQDPDAVRSTACKLVADGSVCATPDTTPPRVPAGAPGAIGVVSLLLWIALAAAVVLGLVVVGRGLMHRRWRRADEPDDADDSDPDDEDLGTALPATLVDRTMEPVQWRHDAEEHRGAGRYRDALRCRYRALVGDLARNGLIDEIPGRTSGEERLQLRRVLPAAQPPFDRAADLFDGAWFGHLEVGERDDDAFIALERDVLLAGAGIAQRRQQPR